MNRGVIAAGHPVTANAADEILRAGGNAFDAAIAAYFAACVAEPVLASLAGGGFLLASDATGRCKVFDFFAQTPRTPLADRDLDFYPIEVDFGSARQEFHIGMGACATPGCVRGIFEVHRHLGRVPMTELVAPACQAAREGVRVNPLQAYIFQLVRGIYIAESARQFGVGEGSMPETGDTVCMPELADLIEALALEGDDLFYRGEIAHRIAALCVEHGGHLTLDDLAGYTAKIRAPLAVNYEDVRVFTNPPPGAGGLLIALALKLIESFAPRVQHFGSYAHLRLMTEVLLKTSDARLRFLSDAHVTEDISVQLLDPSLLELYRQHISKRVQAFSGTTHISIIDSEANVVSMTISNGEGNGYLVPDTGVMLNNMLGEQDLNPAGFHKWQSNQRLSSMMAPTLAQYPDGTVIATGSGGSNRIRTALVQVLFNLVHFAADLETAVTAPRVHVEDRMLNIEGGVDTRVVQRLTADFPEHQVFDELNLFFGGAHTVRRDADGQVIGVGDPRRGGVSAISG